MALAAAGIGLIPLTMKSQAAADVVGDLGVAIQAEGILCLLGERLMTGATIVFLLGMSGDQLAGHQQFTHARLLTLGDTCQ
jgi:hypothetical protein